MSDDVILVNEQDEATGTMEKMEAHEKGLLHRAFSILVFNSKGDLFLQKRSQSKYHSGGLWTNTCCSHPLPGEKMEDAVRRKLIQEMGIDVEPKFEFKFIYKTDLNNQLIEHEYDHVFSATFDGDPVINPDEVEEWKLVSLQDVRKNVEEHPEKYTTWFRLILSNKMLG